MIGNTNFSLALGGEDARRAGEGLLIPELRIFLLLEIIVVEHTDEGGYFLYGICCILGNLLILKAKEHSAIEGVEAGLNLSSCLSVGVLLAKLHDEWKDLVILRTVEWELRTVEQLSMQF